MSVFPRLSSSVLFSYVSSFVLHLPKKEKEKKKEKKEKEKVGLAEQCASEGWGV